ncbi:hypothetical protein [Salmonella enterica]|uniref:Morphogenetic protein n=2 Tax=Salmonella enterica TaxID=28901 RepID=A0A379QJJ8_SALER|nr:hypothetical protein [Salmonella enterica]ECC1658323.1 hypothetical protein [Salmonella enterica subsp. salamae]ASG87580.1 hypothetical protein LFZ47_08275 [Salmonella enterica subsp. salamae serovar 55:k:z39 str. 1315K]ECD9416481.1 hypothetical protein [Salmonella enterica subsp. salamae]ECF5933290.1 hypothetical protein [Salmonella enterica subsp. salamae]ECG1252005.1 hypothetical protein [Salmonella enterica subsp. salamae]
MKERGMIFNAEMVRAILEGRKTQTRRPVNSSTADLLDLQKQYPHKKYNIGCPFGQPGDRLWVRETWAEAGASAPDLTLYRANYPEHVPAHYENVPPVDGIRWTPSIHMPRWASRITLEITSVRVERLNNISYDDAISEGITQEWTCIDPGLGSYAHKNDVQDDYETLWKSIYGADSWQANSWVWVIEFKRVEGATL